AQFTPGATVILDPTGTAVALWTAGDPTKPLTRSLTLYSAARPPGQPWGAPQPLAGPPGAGGQQLAVNASGIVLAVWGNPRVGPISSALRSPDGSWSAPELVPTDGATPAAVLVALDSR